MSEIITDKLTGKTSAGDVDITSEGGAVTMQLQQGLVKWWITLEQDSSYTTHDSFNLSSTSDDGTGKATVTFSNNMSNDDYCVPMGQSDGAGFNDVRSVNRDISQTYTTSQFAFYGLGASAVDDYTRCFVAGIGDLA